MDAVYLQDPRAATLPPISKHMRKHFALIVGTLGVAAGVAFLTPLAQSQNPAAPPAAAKGKGFGRGAPPAGPPGPTPYLPDGHPDITGIWNGQRTVSQDGPYLQPWAEDLLKKRAETNYADDLE